MPASRRNTHTRRDFLRGSLGFAGSCLLAGWGVVPLQTRTSPSLTASRFGQSSREPIAIAAYYFPQYHPDARNDAWHGTGWTEWDLVRRARPRFRGHRQPIVPAWGYFDQSDPAWAAKEIDLAADHGLTCFIYDWYWYEDGPFLSAALERGFLGAPNNGRLKFALMWANHDWLDLFPASAAGPEVLLPGGVSRAAFDRQVDYVIDRFFGRPNYLTIEGEPYFSIYEIETFIAGLGGLEAAGQALDSFRERARRSGFAGLHLNLIEPGLGGLPGGRRRAELLRMIERLGISSVGAYAWIPASDEERGPELPRAEYAAVAERGYVAWDSYLQAPVPYHPAVGMGWDPSPRMAPGVPFAPRGYPWTAVLEGNTPAAFADAIRRAKAFLGRSEVRQKVLTLNAWNEWTEGSYLLPDRAHGQAYLQALASVFPPADRLAA